MENDYSPTDEWAKLTPKVMRNSGIDRSPNVPNREIVKRIVESHDGEFSIESSAGMGSIFQVQLPLMIFNGSIDFISRE
jgi:light-regulated signal transduction histidine kinase (bacteriophytochrome)